MNISSLSRRSFLARGSIAVAAGACIPGQLKANTGSAKAFHVQASQVRCLAVDSDGLIVVAADSQLLFHNPDGTLERSIGTPEPVRALCCHTSGKVLVTFKDRVAGLESGGTFQRIGEPFKRTSALTGLAVSDTGSIFVADSGERVIWRLDASGKLLGQIQPETKGFSVPRAFFPIAWHDGKLVVADPGRHQVQTYSPEGKLLSTWGARSRELDGFSGCCNPVAIAAMPDGSLITAERGQTRLKRFNPEGRLERVLASPEDFAESTLAARKDSDDVFGCQGGLLDVATAPGGKVAVLDRTTCEVRILG